MKLLKTFVRTHLYMLLQHSLRIGLLVMVLAAGAGAQAPPSSATDGSTPLGLQPGAPAGSFALSGFDNVNSYNGNLNFALPLLGIGGRGGAQMAMMLKIDSKGWRVKHSQVAVPVDCGPGSGCGEEYHDVYTPEPNHWFGLVPGYGAGVLVGRQSGDYPTQVCGSGGVTRNIYQRTLTRLTFTAADGTEYELRDQLTGGEPATVSDPCGTGFSRGTIFTSADGTSATFISDTAIVDRVVNNGVSTLGLSGYLLLKDGTRYRIDGHVTWMRDRNGNKISFTYETYGRVATITDSLNRQVTIEYDVTDVAPYGKCDRITYKGFGGAQRILRVSKTTLGNALRSGFALKTYKLLFPELNNAGSTTYNPSDKVSYLWLPNGRSYRLLYNSYGELARVELPTGGAVEYDYTAGSGAITDSVDYQIYRRVVTRRLYKDATTVEGKTTFSDAGAGVITVDHLNGGALRLAREKHYYYGDASQSLFVDRPTNYPEWQQGREYKTEQLDTDGVTVLRRVENTYEQRAAVSWWEPNYPGAAPPNDVRLTQAVTTLLDTGTDPATGAAKPHKVSMQTYRYDQYNNQTDVYEYDYGDGVVGPFRRRTHTEYLRSNPVNGAAYDSLASSATASSMTSSAETFSDAPCWELGENCDPPGGSEPPVADAGGPYSGRPGVSVGFDGSGSTDDIGISSYQWNFGDGTTGTGVTTTHAYAQEGTYTVTLTVMDGDLQGDAGATTATISVSATPTPTPTPPGPTPSPTPTPTPPPPDPTNPDMNATIHIRNLPTEQWVSTDKLGNQKKALTTYEYDNYTPDTGNLHAALLPRTGISGLDASFTPSKKTRGNVTAIARKLYGENSRDITSYQQYDVAGNVVKSIDANLKATTFTYADNFGSPTDNEAQTHTQPVYWLGTKHTYAFATQAKNALNQIAYTQYDYYTGKPVNAEDANGTVYSGYYADDLDRPTKLVSAYADATLRTQTKFIYDDLNRTITTTSDRSVYDDDLLKSELIYDGLGRTVETRQYEDATNYIRVDQQYDGLGRVSKKSNPYRPMARPDSPAETAQLTSITYDELGRVTQVMTPDSAKVNTTYKGNTTTVRDQALKYRESTVDALGRLIEVVEDPNGSPYQTNYEYDVLDNLTKVLQGAQSRTFTYDSLKRLTQAVNPESGKIQYQYDDNGNLLKKIDPRKVPASPLEDLETTFAYDALNRVTSKTYNDQGVTPSVIYKYDAQSLPAGAPASTVFDRGASTGRLVSVTYGGTAAGTYYGYDGLGRVIERVQRTDETNYEVNATYNRAGAMLKETYPVAAPGTSRRVVTHSFDGAGRLASLSTSGAGVTGIKYASHGALSEQSYGTLLHKITYDQERLQPTSIKLEKSTDATIVPLNLSYSYGGTNNNGNVLSSTMTIEAEVWTQTFTYDPLNRIDTAREAKSGVTQWSQNFDYDQYGNRCIRTSGATPCTPNITAAQNNRLAGYGYDLAGNQTSDDYHTYAYDAENHIKSVDAVAAYLYDGEGQRVRKIVGENVRMVYGITGEMVAEFDGTSGALKKEYIYGASGLAATIAAGEGTRYTTADHLGSPRIITNASGVVVSRHDYQPFGEELFEGMGGRTLGQGYSSPMDNLRQKFTGKERDNETGLDYFGYRYYASMLGRWTSVDPLIDFKRNVWEPQAWNQYQYCVNNPVNRTDPDGQQDSIALNGTTRFYNDLINQGFTQQQAKEIVQVYRQVQAPGNIAAIAGLSIVGIAIAGPELAPAALGFFARNPAIKEAVTALALEAAGGPPGAVTGAVGTASKAELSLFQRLASEGKDIEVLATAASKGIQGVRTADIAINGVRVEAKILEGINGVATNGTVKNAIGRALGQSGNVLIDASGVKLTLQEAQRGAVRVFNADNRLKVVRIIGQGFDITLRRGPQRAEF